MTTLNFLYNSDKMDLVKKTKTKTAATNLITFSSHSFRFPKGTVF